MEEESRATPDVDKFLLDYIDSVPHLEALLLVWSSRPRPWPAEELARRLYINTSLARSILQDLVREGLIANGPEDRCHYEPDPEEDKLMADVDAVYKREMIRVSRLIHSKASPAVREFAKAFRFKKEQE